MKRKNISADTALLEVARRHNTTVDEVRKEIRIAMAVECVALILMYRKDGVRFHIMTKSSRRKILSPMLRGNAWRGCKLLYSSHRHVRF